MVMKVVPIVTHGEVQTVGVADGLELSVLLGQVRMNPGRGVVETAAALAVKRRLPSFTGAFGDDPVSDLPPRLAVELRCIIQLVYHGLVQYWEMVIV